MAPPILLQQKLYQLRRLHTLGFCCLPLNVSPLPRGFGNYLLWSHDAAAENTTWLLTPILQKFSRKDLKLDARGGGIFLPELCSTWFLVNMFYSATLHKMHSKTLTASVSVEDVAHVAKSLQVCWLQPSFDTPSYSSPLGTFLVQNTSHGSGQEGSWPKQSSTNLIRLLFPRHVL